MATPDTPPADPVEQVAAALESVARRLFSAWRRALSTLVHAARRAARLAGASIRRWSSQWERVPRYYVGREPFGASDDAHVGPAAFGLRAFAFGVLAGGAITIATGDTARAAIATLLVECMWVVGRYVVCAALLPQVTLPRRRLTVIFLAGLAPYLIGVTGLLRIVALAASALLTARGLRRAGVGDRDTRTAVAWAFGGQALVVAFGFMVRGGIVALAGG